MQDEDKELRKKQAEEFFSCLNEHMKYKTRTSELANALGIYPQQVSNCRNATGKAVIGRTLIMKAHKLTGIPVAKLERLAGYDVTKL